MTITRHCAICGEVIFTGRTVDYECPPGFFRQDIEGKYFQGAGECEICEKFFCEEHLRGGLCEQCAEEDEEYVPV